MSSSNYNNKNYYSKPQVEYVAKSQYNNDYDQNGGYDQYYGNNKKGDLSMNSQEFYYDNNGNAVTGGKKKKNYNNYNGNGKDSYNQGGYGNYDQYYNQYNSGYSNNYYGNGNGKKYYGNETKPYNTKGTKYSKNKANANEEQKESPKITVNEDNEQIEDTPDTDQLLEPTEPGEFEDFNVPLSELTELLTQRFNKRKVECPICYNKIKSEAKIWSCKQCFGPFHLGCIQKWIYKNPTNDPKNGKPPALYMWTCPKCCYLYSEVMPQYHCFCKKNINPDFDGYNTPHSCGEICGKLRGASCVHPCNMSCHPGPCPPCGLLGKVKTCFCGKNSYHAKCSDDSENFSCQKKCEKPLNCGKHQCQQNCHKGSCLSCTVMVEASCHCNKETKEVHCGKENFSCHKECGNTLNCGNHPCTKVCHEGPCAPCLYTPDRLKTCACGKMSLASLGFGNRKSCLDPVPSCGLPCPKKCSNNHPCKKSCHPGECPPCKFMVEQICRCTKNSRKMDCYSAVFGDESDTRYLCDSICSKKKSCGIHKCGQACCDATKNNDIYGNHLCLKVCGKNLNCKKHTCELFCHLGDCKACPIIVNQPVACTCGKTVKNPPLQCPAEPPSCNYPCTRQKPCGHECLLNCHTDACPPCEELVEKMCNCGKSSIKGVKCSKEVLCGKVCDVLLACGHKCGEVCHKGECNYERGIKGCGRRCGKKREICDHPCMAFCHPGKDCPKDRCKVEVKITCECGNRETWGECGSTDKKEIKVLKCDKSCSNLKRFGGFIQKEATKKPYYPGSLVRFAKSELSFVLKLEDKVEKMLKDGKDSFDIPLTDYSNSKKNAVQVLLSRHYNMVLEFYLNVRNPCICVRTTPKTIIPKMKLSEYLRQIETHQIKPEILPFEATLKFHSLTSYDSSEELEGILKEYEGSYYIERIAEKNILVHFWTVGGAKEAIKTLKKSHSNFSNVSMEENIMLKGEEEKIKINEDEIIVEEKPPMTEEENKSAFLFLSLNNKSS
jgi:transcriptional repressor NF-X1